MGSNASLRQNDALDTEPVDAESSSLGAAERTIRALRLGIERGVYAPGQRLVELDLTSELTVSRSSLREAFRRLSAEGIIEIIPNRGAVVRRLSETDIRNTQQIRNLLEPLAASLAATSIAERGHSAYFDKAAAPWLGEPPVHDIDEFAHENRRFHQVIVELSGNEQLATIIERLNMPLFAAHFRQRITVEMRIKAASDHRRIALAIRAGDSQAAQEAMALHISHSTEIVSSDPGSAPS